MITRLLIYYNFVLLTIMTIVGFLGTQNFKELSSAIFFFPMAVYFGLMVVPQRSRAIILPQNPNKQVGYLRNKKSSARILIKEVDNGPLDTDRRRFLKLIGSAGLALFLFAIFTKKAQGAFFGSVPGPGTITLKDSSGALVDPAVKHPTDGYRIARLDDNTPAYYGFLNKDGAWFIMREESDGTYKYAKGSVNFQTTGWDLRSDTGFAYADFDAVFE